MSDENTIRKLFLEAQQLDPAEREAFVERATKGNAALRSELLSLLSASNEADSFFDRFAGRIGREAMLDKLASKPARPWPNSETGDTIGAYTLVREFGRGGMGTVWLAERNDGRFELRSDATQHGQVGPGSRTRLLGQHWPEIVDHLLEIGSDLKEIVRKGTDEKDYPNHRHDRSCDAAKW